MPTATKTTRIHVERRLSPRKKAALAESLPNDKVEAAQKKRPLLAKSRNPEFRASTLYLRKKTLTECEYRLKITDDKRDMSELVEELMTAFLSTPAA